MQECGKRRRLRIGGVGGQGGVTDLSRCDSSESFHGEKRFLWPCSDAKLSVTLRLNPAISLAFLAKPPKNRKTLH